MPKKTKDSNIEEKKSKKISLKEIISKKTVASTTSKTTKNSTKSTTTTSKATAKKSQSPNEKVATDSASKKTATQKTTTAKATSTKKAQTPKKAETTKTKTAQKTKTTKTKTTRKSSKTVIPIEYYDLPYRYNQTIVKILAQTPTNLFIYWDISDEDRENYKELYGENFFEETRPVLIIHNDTLNYSFEIEINDFANSWYLHVNDSKCNYRVELGRRPYENTVASSKTNYIYISSSNEIEAPNDKILFNPDAHMVYYRDVKTNLESTKNISFIKSMGKIYHIYDLYKEIYPDESIDMNTLPTTNSSVFK